jgi:hypothetical protein
MMKRSRRLAAALVVPAVLLVGACGQDDKAGAAGDSTTSQAPAPTGSSTGTTPAGGSGQAGAVHEDKAAFIEAVKKGTSAASSAHVDMKMEGEGQQVVIEGVTKFDADPAMQLSMDMAGLKLDLIVLDGNVYIKGMPGAADAGKWARFDKDSEIAQSMLDSASAADPNAMFEDFEKVVTDVKHVGPESVDGEDMQKYELTMNPKAAGNEDATALPDEVTYNVWLDAKDRMRKITFDLEGIKADIRMDKYDEPVDIKAPAAGDVVDGSN